MKFSLLTMASIIFLNSSLFAIDESKKKTIKPRLKPQLNAEKVESNPNLQHNLNRRKLNASINKQVQLDGEEYAMELLADQNKTNTFDGELNELNSSSVFHERRIKLSDAFKLALQNDTKYNGSLKDAEAAYYKYVGARASAWGMTAILTSSVIYGNRTVMNPATDSSPKAVVSTDGTTATAGFNITQPIFNLAKILTYNQAEYADSVAKVRVVVIQQDLIMRVVQSYLEVLKLEESLKYKNEEVSGTRTQYEILKEQEEVGLVASAQVDDAKGQLDLAEADKINLESQLAIAKGVLFQNWRVNPDLLKKKIKEKAKFLPPNPNNISKWIEQARVDNLNVRYNEGLLGISEFDPQIARAALYYPVFTATAGCQTVHSNQAFFGISNGDSDACSVGVSVAIPIWDGGVSRVKAYEMEAVKGRILEETNNVKIQSAQFARQSFTFVDNGIKSIEKLKSAVSKAQSALDGKIELYKNGQVLNIEVLSALIKLNNIKFRFASEKYNYIINKLSLKQSVGRLSSDDLDEIDEMLE